MNDANTDPLDLGVQVITTVPEQPKPLPSELLPVKELGEDLLPEKLRPWLSDIAERMQAPPDFAAVSAMVAAGSLLGNKVAIQPKVHDTGWTEHPNVWGMLVGRPSMMKTPVMKASMAPFESICSKAKEGHRESLQLHAAAVEARRMRCDGLRKAVKKRIEKGEVVDDAELIFEDEPITPGLRRPQINNATLEALHEILMQNPNGSLLYQDEIAGLLARLRDPERGGELRAFLLSAWSGDLSYTSDRIGRGLNLHVPRCCLSLLGSTQPGKLAPLVASAVKEDFQDDGFLQRFGLVCWPDMPNAWVHIDREPNGQAYANACEVFERLEKVPGGDEDPYVYTFTAEAAEMFASEFLTPLQARLRSDELSPALESHLSKFRKTVPALALLFELIDHADPRAVSADSLRRALAWGEYLESHAMRFYASGPQNETQAAKLIIRKLKAGSIPRLDDEPKRNGQAPFTVRQIQRGGWSGLTDKSGIDKAVELLIAHGWLHETTKKTAGRSAKLLHPHPSIITDRP
ncbi:YfjI family protein [bacterium]|nr:YfjI family protein [bacterium]